MFSFIHASNFSIGFYTSYNVGTSDFFNESNLYLNYSGKSFIETTRNKLGVGFHLNVNIPLLKKLYISPGVTWIFGHQHYVYQEEEKEDGEVNDFFFNLYGGEVNLFYDLLKLRGGWQISAMAGLNYNYFKADSEMREDDKKFLGFQTGLAFKFFQIKKFGFQGLVFYRMPLGSGYFSYLGLMVGIIYNL